MLLHRAVGPRQQIDIAAALGKEVGIGKEEAFRGIVRRPEQAHDLGLGQARGVVAKVRMRVEALAHLPESPAFDERQFRLREVATRQLFQQFQQRDAARDLVASGLDRRFDAHHPGQHDQHPGVQFNARCGDLPGRGAQAAAGHDGEFDLIPRQIDRRQRQSGDQPSSSVSAKARQKDSCGGVCASIRRSRGGCRAVTGNGLRVVL